MRHLAANISNISSPKVRELHDHFLWRERTQIKIFPTQICPKLKRMPQNIKNFPSKS